MLIIAISGVGACRNALFLTDPIVDRETLKTEKGRRTLGTCEWIRTADTYKAWIAGDIGGLWISGRLGQGKTMLSMFLTEELGAHIRERENSELLFYFCVNQDTKRNNATAVLRSLVVSASHEAPEFVPFHLDSFRR